LVSRAAPQGRVLTQHQGYDRPQGFGAHLKILISLRANSTSTLCAARFCFFKGFGKWRLQSPITCAWGDSQVASFEDPLWKPLRIQVLEGCSRPSTIVINPFNRYALLPACCYGRARLWSVKRVRCRSRP
jgi:hypothetical protein